MRTVLQICQEVARRTKLPVPTTISSAPDASSLQLGAMLQEVIEYLIENYDWQTNINLATHVTLAAEDQGSIYTIAGSSYKKVVKDTLWNTTLRRPVFGPVASKSRQVLRTMIPTGPTHQYWIVQDHLRLSPTPPAGQTVTFEWHSKDAWINGATRKTAFSDDADQPLLDDQMLVVGLRAFWKREQGHAYADLLEQMEAMAQARAAADGTKETIHLDCPEGEIRPGVIVPAGSWNV